MHEIRRDPTKGERNEWMNEWMHFTSSILKSPGKWILPELQPCSATHITRSQWDEDLLHAVLVTAWRQLSLHLTNERIEYCDNKPTDKRQTIAFFHAVHGRNSLLDSSISFALRSQTQPPPPAKVTTARGSCINGDVTVSAWLMTTKRDSGGNVMQINGNARTCLYPLNSAP